MGGAYSYSGCKVHLITSYILSLITKRSIERRKNSGEQYVQLKSLHKKFSKKGWLLNNVAMVWSAYHCVHMALLVCVLCQASAFIEPFLHQLDLFFRNFFMETCNCSCSF